MRIGPRFNVKCNNNTNSSGFDLPWVNEIRYLGIYIVKSRSFKCSFAHVKRAFYRSLNAVFGHIGRSASEDVVINLVRLYGTEVCPVSKSDTNSVDFTINRCLMKLFKTNNINIIKECRVNFGEILPSSLITSRTNV